MERWMILFNINLMLLLMFSITYFLNKASNSGIFFGVKFPLEYLKKEELIQLEKSYKKAVLLVFLILFIGVNIIILNMNIESEGQLNMFLGIFTVVLIIGVNLLYIPYYMKAKNLKKEKGWTYKKRNVVVTDTTLRKPKKDDKLKPMNPNWLLILLIVPIVLSILTMYKYNNLPEVMNIPNTTFNEFNKNTGKGFLILYQFPISQISMIIFMYIISRVIINSRVDLNSGAIENAVMRKKKFRRLGSILMMVITIEIVIMFSFIQLAILYILNMKIINYIFTIIISITTFIFIMGFIKIGQGGKNLQREEETDELYKDDDDKWVLGGFYYNKNDPAWMVEKRRGIGWTINFANSKSWIFLGGIIIFIIISSIIGRVI